MAYSETLIALADPTRRQLLEALRKGERTVGDLARLGGISQPAVSQHLRVLQRARLVRERRAGTRHYFCADLAGLDELRKYVDSLWDDVLAAFAASQEDHMEDETK